MPNWPPNYKKIKSLQAEPEPLDVWLSPEIQDPRWDDFLRSTPYGQFQQSGMWADYKAGEGWQHYRVIVTSAAEIVGGFQILWKKKGLVRIGYVSKGPVVSPENPTRVQQLKELLCEATRHLKLIALIAQDPDEAQHFTNTSEALGFVESNPAQLVETTYLVDVSDDMETVRRRMSQSHRKHVRKAQKLGVEIRIGTETDLPHFYNLMAATCARQNTSPNPANAPAFYRLWRAFSPTHSIRLTLAERGGLSPAGLVCLVFGNRTSLWKKGWDGSMHDWNTGTFLEDNALEWAHVNGSKIGDFCAITRFTALHVLSGKGIANAPLPTNDQFKLRFGGYPKILPSAYIYFPNPILRWGYRTFYPFWGKYRNRSNRPNIDTESLKAADNT